MRFAPYRDEPSEDTEAQMGHNVPERPSEAATTLHGANNANEDVERAASDRLPAAQSTHGRQAEHQDRHHDVPGPPPSAPLGAHSI